MKRNHHKYTSTNALNRLLYLKNYIYSAYFGLAVVETLVSIILRIVNYKKYQNAK